MSIYRVFMLSLIALMLALGLPALAEDGASDPLAGTSWQLELLGGEPVGGDSTVTLIFGTDGSIGGNGGCNVYGGGYTVDGDSLTFTNVFSTMMFCDPTSQQETTYLAALNEASAYTFDGDRLVIVYDEGLQLVFAPMTMLDGTSWQLASIDGAAQVEGTTVTLSFDADRASGFSGCNNFNAGFVIDGQSLTFDTVASTRRACLDEAASQQEQALFEALQGATEAVIEDRQLTIRYDDGKELVFMAVMALEGTSWELTRIGGETPLADSLVTLSFGDVGRVSGSGGCNRFNGSFEVSGSEITFGSIASTRMACPGGRMEQEQAFFQALEAAISFQATADVLTIETSDGQTLEFAAAALEASA
ncbi:MAG: META domain-containing protein [Chloroflexi bacterium]|nr:META domain-containing protein [Chloroflexota bacterium]